MTDVIEFPAMRAEVLEALRALSDPERQRATWGRYEPGLEYYDDLDMNIHILYDDCAVLPEPARSVGTIIYPQEVPAFAELADALGPMLQDLGDAPDDAYMSDPRWVGVVGAAGAALTAMQRAEEGPAT